MTQLPSTRTVERSAGGTTGADVASEIAPRSSVTGTSIPLILEALWYIFGAMHSIECAARRPRPSPPLYPGPMRVYDAPGKRALTLVEAAGAWLPADPTHALAEARWNMG